METSRSCHQISVSISTSGILVPCTGNWCPLAGLYESLTTLAPLSTMISTSRPDSSVLGSKNCRRDHFRCGSLQPPVFCALLRFRRCFDVCSFRALSGLHASDVRSSSFPTTRHVHHRLNCTLDFIGPPAPRLCGRVVQVAHGQMTPT